MAACDLSNEIVRMAPETRQTGEGWGPTATASIVYPLTHSGADVAALEGTGDVGASVVTVTTESCR